ncbi:hypothetical protein [Cupriavidus basilensis]
MSRQKKPRRKAYRPCWNGGGAKLRAEPWKVEAVFGPLERILDAIDRDGCVTATKDGVPVFQDCNDGDWYEMAPAIEGVVAAYEIHAKRQARELPLQPLKRLVMMLRYAMPLQQSDVDAARASIATLRHESMEMRADYARDLVRTTQVRIELDKQEAG